MEGKKIQVAEEGNKRGDKLSIEELRQCIADLRAWFETAAPSVHAAITQAGAVSQAQLSEAKIAIPIAVQELLKVSNGQFQLHDGFKTLSLTQLVDANEINAVSSYWKKNDLAFARDNEGNYLVTNTEAQQVLNWNADEGVVEQVSGSIDLYLEKLRNDVLKKELEFIDEIGLVKSQG